jgi:hypothetical protein
MRRTVESFVRLIHKLLASDPHSVPDSAVQLRFDSIDQQLSVIAKESRSKPRIHWLAIVFLAALFAWSFSSLLQGLQQNQDASEDITQVAQLDGTGQGTYIIQSTLDTDVSEALTELMTADTTGDRTLISTATKNFQGAVKNEQQAANGSIQASKSIEQAESSLPGAFNQEDQGVFKIALSSVILGGIGSYALQAFAERSRSWRRRTHPK